MSERCCGRGRPRSGVWAKRPYLSFYDLFTASAAVHSRVRVRDEVAGRVSEETGW